MAVTYGKKTQIEMTPEQKLAQRNDNIARYRKSIGKTKPTDAPIQGTGLDTLKKYIPDSSSGPTPITSGGDAEDLVKSLQANKQKLPTRKKPLSY